jgi:hypothetical protein
MYQDAVILAAARNKREQHDCGQNPAFNPLDPDDPRDVAGPKIDGGPHGGYGVVVPGQASALLGFVNGCGPIHQRLRLNQF